MLIPLAATLAGTFSLVYTKYLMSQRKMGYLPYTVQSFWAILLVLLPGIFFIPPPQAISLQDIILFILMVVLACFWNIIFYHGIKEESLIESQLVVMLVPLLAALFGFVFFQDERKIATLLFLVMGVAAIAWAHISHHQLKFHSGSWLIIIASIFIAFESVLVKLILPAFTIYWLYFMRVVAITLILTIFFPKAAKPDRSTIVHMIAIGILVAFQFIMTYWSFIVYGIVFSNLIFSLLPLFTATAGYFIFHEHVSRKQLLAGIILLVCVVIATIF